MPSIATDDLVTLRRNYRTQKTLRQPQEPIWEDIEYYTGAVREEGVTQRGDGGGGGHQQRKDLWDFTAIDGREKLSASMQGAVSNAHLRWFLLAYRASALNRDSEAKSWLDEESENVWNDLQDSDFNTEIGCNYYDLTGPGHTFLAIEPIVSGYDEKTLKEEWGGVDFTALPLDECYFDQDRKGEINRFWRRLMWMPTQIADFCESKEIPVPEDITEKIQKGSEEKEEIVFCVFPRKKILARAQKKGVTYPARPELRPWGCVYWREKNGEELYRGGYYEKPIHMCRWSRTAGSKWGHGPSNIALPTVKYVNAWKEAVKLAAEKAVNPPYITEERNLASTVDLDAGGLTVVRNIEKIKELTSSARFDVGEKMIEEDRAEIRRIYRTDELQLKDSPAMTATEAQIRYELMNRVLGKTLTFIQNDLLSPIVLTIMAMRLRLGVAKPMPAKVRKAGGIFTIEYQGPLARSQRTDEVAAIERAATFVAGLAQFYPEVRAAFDPIKAVKHIFNRLGVPADVIPNESDMRKEMERMKQEMARNMAADSKMKEAKAAKDMSGSMQGGGGGGGGAITYPTLPPVPPLAPSGAVA